MNKKVLVTYASQGGSTAGVAEAISQALSENGALAEVLPVQQVDDPGRYQAVVIGSAIHGGKWMPEALAFLDSHRESLRRMPAAVFQVCMMLACPNENYRRMPPEWLAPLRAQVRPVAEGSFAGALWPDRYSKLSMKLGLRVFLASVRLKAGDYRDWNAIRAWAHGLPALLLR
jgi:menaquinone-dependent protoporphyrinogen oxidase